MRIQYHPLKKNVHYLSIVIQLTQLDTRAITTQLHRNKDNLRPKTYHWFLYCLGEYLLSKEVRF